MRRERAFDNPERICGLGHAELFRSSRSRPADPLDTAGRGGWCGHPRPDAGGGCPRGSQRTGTIVLPQPGRSAVPPAVTAEYLCQPLDYVLSYPRLVNCVICQRGPVL